MSASHKQGEQPMAHDLIYNPASPYARKTLVIAYETGLLETLNLKAVQVWEEEDAVRVQNPLGKIPVLIHERVGALYDSRVICDFLISESNKSDLMPGGEQRWVVERQDALGQGTTDAALSLRADVTRGLDKDPDWYSQRMTRTVLAGIDEMGRMLPEYKGTFTLGTVALACALSYVDFRHDHLNWRDGRNALADWHAEILKRPSFTSLPSL